MLRRDYLREHKDGIYTGLLLTGELNAHLEKVDREANEMMERLVPQMAKKCGVTERLKAEDQMKWVGLMNSVESAAEEIVIRELVYG